MNIAVQKSVCHRGSQIFLSLGSNLHFDSLPIVRPLSRTPPPTLSLRVVSLCSSGYQPVIDFIQFPCHARSPYRSDPFSPSQSLDRSTQTVFFQ